MTEQEKQTEQLRNSLDSDDYFATLLMNTLEEIQAYLKEQKQR